MKSTMNSETNEVMNALHYRPSISVIMPFEPKMSLKTELQHALKVATDKIEKELTGQYPDDICLLIMHKLKLLIKNLNYNTHKKGIAIYVSPVFEKVLYLDIAVEEKIIIDGSFEIRDLVYSKKQINKYLVMILSSRNCQVFLGNTTEFVRIITNSSDRVSAAENDLPERVANFADMSERHEIQTKKFLLDVDNSLKLILASYPLPLFVLGAEKVLGYFKSITKHSGSVVEYIHGNYEMATIPQLIKVLEPYKANWKNILEKNLLNKLDDAAGAKRLVHGIKEVWRAAANKNGQLLLVEKNYMYVAQQASDKEVIYKVQEPYNKFSYIKDAVDDVIEKVLEGGGDVEFVEDGMLKAYNHIALIKFY